jgi:predicted PurR-regulated permease PerM
MTALEEVNWSRNTWILYGLVLGGILAYIVWRFVGTFVFGLFIYYATRPFHRRIRRHVRQRTVAATLSLLTLAVPIVLLIAYTTAIALQELGRFQSRADLGPLADVLGPYIDVSAIVENPASLLQDAGGMETIQSMVDQTLSYLGLLGGTLIHAFVMFAVAFYLLRDGHRLKRIVSAVGDEHGVLDTYLGAVDRSLSKVFFGNLLNAVMTAAIGAITFSVYNVFAPGTLQVPYPALMGVLAGVASLIPIVGMKLVWIPLAGYLGVRAYTIGEGWGFVAAFALLSIVIVDAIPDFALRPYVSGRSLHVGSVMIAYIIGPLLFGWPGIFLGPMLLVVVMQFVRIVLPELLAGREIQPYSFDPGSMPVEGTASVVGEGEPEAVDDSTRSDRTASTSTPADRSSSDAGAVEGGPADASET